MISNSAGFIVGLLLFFDVLDEEVVALGEGVADVDLLLAGEALEKDGLFAFFELVASEVVVEGDFYFHCCVLCFGSRERLLVIVGGCRVSRGRS